MIARKAQRVSWPVAGIGVALILSGCSSAGPGCKPDKAYSETAPTKPLTVPTGMAPLETTGAPIPEGPRDTDPIDEQGRCLEEPPSFFAESADEAMEGMPVAQDPGVVAGGAATPDPEVVAAPGSIQGASILANEVAVFLAAWAQDWNRRDSGAYFTYYEPGYYPSGYDDVQDWQTTQRERFQIPAHTDVMVETIEVEPTADGMARAQFVQRFGHDPDYRSVKKEMELISGGEHGWLISTERIVDVL
jgi:hypothetical protein